MDLDAVLDLDAGCFRRLQDPVLAPDQDRLAEALVVVGDCRPDDGFFLALGEHDALGSPLYLLIDTRQHAGHGITAGIELAPVGLEIDRLAGNAGVHRSLGNRGGNRRHQARIERSGNDVALAEFRAGAAIGRGDFVGHILARQFGDGECGGDLHFHVDLRGAHIEGARGRCRGSPGRC